MFSFGPARARRRPSLTPMIDVVFLLLVFFMLASRFGHDAVLDLALAGAPGASWQGPPRLVDLGAGGALRLNGTEIAPEALAGALSALMSGPDDPVILRAQGADLQALIGLMERLRAAGITRLVLVEGA